MTTIAEHSIDRSATDTVTESINAATGESFNSEVIKDSADAPAAELVLDVIRDAVNAVQSNVAVVA